MNAKKIMGAVLVALLAAALFTGAVAADNKGTYFAFQNGTAGIEGVWMNGDNKVTVTDGVVSAVPVAGTYTQGEDTAYFTNPTATYVANGKYESETYIVNNGGNLYAGSNLSIVATSLNATKAGVDALRIQYPNGSVNFVSPTFFNVNAPAITEAGLYKVQAVWNNKTNFTTGAPLPVIDANVFTFNVVEADDATISASVDTVFAGDVVGVTIKGTPGVEYSMNLTGINASAQITTQIVTLNPMANHFRLNFTMPNIGEVTFQLATEEDAKDEVKIALLVADEDTEVIDEVIIAVANPTLTATLGANSYFIGDEIELTVTSDIDIKYGSYTFNITGTNFKDVTLEKNTKDSKDNGKSFTVYLKTQNVKSEGKKLDVGTYTIKMIQAGDVKKTITVALKQPFITIADAPEVVVQGDDAEFVINAEAAANITAYVFGTNFFYWATIVDADKGVSNQFTVKIAGEKTNNMSTGQYFAVFQHPMYDQFFNILSNVSGDFYLNTKATAQTNVIDDQNSYLFSAKDRQTANAAQALCDALESQNIDDMYVKASFFIVSKADAQYTISEIPTTVAQGETITISGVDTANKGAEVAVQMLSTAFAAVPKETAGSAAFVLVTTEVAEDGTWEVTLDTSDLAVDEYGLTVKIAEDLKKSVTVNVVEAADKPDTPDTPDVPDTPDTPDTPTEPETPGFGALAALAGLGAVAVLLLRRE